MMSLVDFGYSVGAINLRRNTPRLPPFGGESCESCGPVKPVDPVTPVDPVHRANHLIDVVLDLIDVVPDLMGVVLGPD